MWQCPNRACPFQLRHGFAAEYRVQVERCRSCDAPLEPLAPSPGGASARARTLRAFARLGVTLLIGVGLAAFANLDVPGLDAGSPLDPFGEPAGSQITFADLSLAPALAWLISGAVLVELGALALPAARPWRHRVAGRRKLHAYALMIAMLGLIVQSGMATGLQPVPLLSRVAGLPLLLGLAAANHRWGLGHGLSVVVVALLGHALTLSILASPAPLDPLLTLLAMIMGFAIWLARPARASARARSPLTRDDNQARELGLGLSIPSCGLVPFELYGVLLALLYLSPAGVELLGGGLWLKPVLVLGFGALFAFAFTRPALLVERWTRAFPRADEAALASEAKAVFRRGLVHSELLLVVMLALMQTQLPVTEAVIVAAILLDLEPELRLRLREGELVALPTHLDLPAAEALALALRLEGTPAGLQGQHHRSLSRLFGWWLPTQVLVPPAKLDAATQLRQRCMALAPEEDEELDEYEDGDEYEDEA